MTPSARKTRREKTKKYAAPRKPSAASVARRRGRAARRLSGESRGKTKRGENKREAMAKRNAAHKAAQAAT